MWQQTVVASKAKEEAAPPAAASTKHKNALQSISSLLDPRDRAGSNQIQPYPTYLVVETNSEVDFTTPNTPGQSQTHYEQIPRSYLLNRPNPHR
jgi:hypothetical protein